MITRAAKDFLQSANKSSRYIKAADSAVEQAMRAIKAKIEERVRRSVPDEPGVATGENEKE